MQNPTHKWQDKVPDSEVIEQTGIKSVYTMMLLRAPHYPQKIFYGELWDGKLTIGGQKKRYKDSLKETFKELQIDVNILEKQSKVRITWRQTLYDGQLTDDSNRIQKTKDIKNSLKDCGTEQRMISFLLTVWTTLPIKSWSGEPPQINQTLNPRLKKHGHSRR